MKRLALLLITSTLCHGAEPGPDVDALLKQKAEQRRQELNETIPALLKIQKEVNAKNKYFKAKTKKDAGPILNPRIEWTGVKENEDNKRAYAEYLNSLGDSSPPSLKLSDDLVDKLKLAGPDFLKKAKSFDLKDLDFQWITDLKKYDFWEIGENSPWVYLPKFSFTTSPIPDFILLMEWSKLNLVKGVQTHNLPKATDEVMHLAKLAHSTETLIGTVAALQMIRYASQSEDFQRHGQYVDDKFTKMMKSYLMQYLATASNPLVDAHALEQLLAAHGPGYCAVVNEAGEGILTSKPLLESEAKDVYAYYDHLLSTSKACRWLNLKKAWSGDGHYVLPFNYLPTADLEHRKQALEALKAHLEDGDFKLLSQDLSSPRWPQHFGYVMALMKPKE